MVVIRWFILSLILSITVFGQFDWFDKKQNYYLYDSAITKETTNISYTFATIKGDYIRQVSNKGVNEATKRNRQLWMVLVDVDSIRGFEYTPRGLTSGTEYSYYHSYFVYQNNGNVAYFKGAVRTFTTLTIPEGLLLATEDDNYVLTEDNNFIKFDEE